MVAFTVSPVSPASRKVVLATTIHNEHILSAVAEAKSSLNLNQSLDLPYFQAQHPTLELVKDQKAIKNPNTVQFDSMTISHREALT